MRRERERAESREQRADIKKQFIKERNKDQSPEGAQGQDQNDEQGRGYVRDSSISRKAASNRKGQGKRIKEDEFVFPAIIDIKETTEEQAASEEEAISSKQEDRKNSS